MRFFTPLLLLALLSLNAYAQTDAQAKTPWSIGVLYWSNTIAGQIAMRKGLEEEAEKINREAKSTGKRPIVLTSKIAGDGPQGIENQIQQMVQLVATKPDAIIVQPTDNAALAGPLIAANRAGIPVIAYDQYISEGTLASFITSNNDQAGRLGGEYLASLFPDEKPMQLVLVEYPSVSSTVERLNGFLDALQERGQAYRILASFQAVQPEEGARAAHAILKQFPDKGSIDAIFTVNDGGGLSVVDILAAAGRTEIVVATVDGDPASVANIKAKRLTRIDSAQFCGPLGATAMRTTYQVLLGKKVSPQILIPSFPITTQTLTRYPGWAGPIPAAFQKPWPSRTPLWQNRLVEAP
ncbi:D-ribose periplasmic binding protein precursor [gamma proteobacterium HdN1]|nr:D-ribose periplasmic binding protein precursor [gamma proteobacterium HdN1]